MLERIKNKNIDESTTGSYLSTTIVKKRREKKKKKWGNGLGYEGWGLSKGEVWVVGGANALDSQGWKRPWELWGVGLRLKEQKGPRRAPHPWSQRAGDLTWDPSRLPGLKWVGKRPPFLSSYSGRAPPACLS